MTSKHALPKGYIAVDGTSFTVGEVGGGCTGLVLQLDRRRGGCMWGMHWCCSLSRCTDTSCVVRAI